MIIRRPHNPLGVIATAATVHLAAAVPNFASMEIRASPSEDYGFYDRDLFPVQMEQDGPRMRVPTRPGLGVELNEELGGSPGGRLPADRDTPPATAGWLDRELAGLAGPGGRAGALVGVHTRARVQSGERGSG